MTEGLISPGAEYTLDTKYWVFQDTEYTLDTKYRVFQKTEYTLDHKYRVFQKTEYTLDTKYRVFQETEYTLDTKYRVFQKTEYTLDTKYRVFQENCTAHFFNQKKTNVHYRNIVVMVMSVLIEYKKEEIEGRRNERRNYTEEKKIVPGINTREKTE